MVVGWVRETLLGMVLRRWHFDFGWEGIWRKCSAIVCIYLSEIHIECEVHELFWEISNWKNEHCNTNSDWNSTWVIIKTIAGQIISVCVYMAHTIVWPDSSVVADLKIVEDRGDVHWARFTLGWLGPRLNWVLKLQKWQIFIVNDNTNELLWCF